MEFIQTFKGKNKEFVLASLGQPMKKQSPTKPSNSEAYVGKAVPSGEKQDVIEMWYLLRARASASCCSSWRRASGSAAVPPALAGSNGQKPRVLGKGICAISSHSVGRAKGVVPPKPCSGSAAKACKKTDRSDAEIGR